MTAPVSWTQGADDLETLSDVELVDRVRLGDISMYSELWNRHHDAGLRAAAKITRRYEAEDLVQEAFARTLSTIRGGKGPRDAFRPYLYAAIRNVSMTWARDEIEHGSLDDLDGVADPEALFDDAVLDRTITGRAFASLRPEWRTILWYTAVEGLPPREAGTYLGLSATAAAALAYRAREGLRAAWIQAHVSTGTFDQECTWSVCRMGAYERGQLGEIETGQFEDHLTVCLHCSILVEELDNVADRLRSMLVPLIVGPGLANAVEGLGWGASSGAEPAPARMDTTAVSGSAGLSAPSAASPVMTAVAVILTGALVLSGGWVVWHDFRTGAQEVSGGLSAPPGQQPPSSADEDAVAPVEPAIPAQEPEELQLDEPQPDQPGGANASRRRDRGVDGIDGPLTGSESDDAASYDTAPSTSPIGPTGPTTSPTGPTSPTMPPATDPAPDLYAARPAPPQVTGLVQSLYLPELSGTAEPDADVIAVAGGVVVARTTADAQGAWSATLQFDEVAAAPIDVVVYQEVDGQRSDAAQAPERIELRAPTVVGVAVTPSPTVTVTGVPGTVIHVAVDGLVTAYQHAVGDVPVVRALIGLGAGPHVVAVRYADPSTGRHGAWARTAFTVP